MRLRAEDARLAHVSPGQRQSFHDERSYPWVKAVLDAPLPENRRYVEGQAILASQVVVGDAPLDGLLAIGSVGSANVVLYTPDAPDGKHFREFADWENAIALFFHAPAFEHYLADRSADPYQGFDPSLPIARRDVSGDPFIASWETAIDIATHHLPSMDADDDTDVVLSVMLKAPYAAPTPPWRDVDTSWAATPGRIRRNVASWILRPVRVATSRAAASVTHLRTAAAAPMLFDDAFRARGMLRQGAPDRHGLYTIQGRTYIAQGNELYAARYDSAFDTVRLQRPNASPTSYGPAIHRLGADRWTHRRVGLLGGRDATGNSSNLFPRWHAPANPQPPLPPPPAGHRLLAAADIPERVHAPWFGAPNHISGVAGTDGYTRYLRMDVRTVSAGQQGVPVRSTPTPPSPGNRAQSIVIQLRDAYARLDATGQPRFDVYRSNTDPDAIILRPRSAGALEFRDAEFLTTPNPSAFFPPT